MNILWIAYWDGVDLVTVRVRDSAWRWAHPDSDEHIWQSDYNRCGWRYSDAQMLRSERPE